MRAPHSFDKRRGGASGLAAGSPDVANRQAEQACLAGLLSLIDREPAAVREIVADLAVDMWSIDYGPEIFKAITEAVCADRPAIGDVAALLRRQAAAEGFDPADAYQALTGLAVDLYATGPHAARLAAEAALEVRQAHGRRAWLWMLEDARAGGQATPAEIARTIAEAERIREIIDPVGGRHGRPAALAMVSILDRWARNETEPLVRTMFGPIDKAFGGGLSIGLTGIAARPGDGKSALAGQLVLGALLADRTAKAVWFRGEMTDDQLAAKMLATWSSLRDELVPFATFGDALKRRPSARKVAVDMSGIVGDRLQVIDPPLTPDAMERQIASIRPKLAIVDYLQLCEAPGEPDRRASVEAVTRRLARMATKYEVAIVVVSAIAKATSEATGIGALAKDSNNLDYDVHAFLTLWSDGPKDKDPRPMKMRVEKGRTGGAGDVALYFDGKGQFFRPAVPELYEAEAAAVPFQEFEKFAPGGEGR